MNDTAKPKSGRETKEQRWEPPPRQWIKLNFDGAYDEGIGEGAYAIIARNHEGLRRSKAFKGTFDY